MWKVIKVILLVILALLVLGKLGRVLIKNKLQEALQQEVYHEKVTASKELADNGGVALDLVSYIPSAQHWEEYSFPNEGFIIRFPSEPTIKRIDSQYITFRSQIHAPGENVKYSVQYWADKGFESGGLDYVKKTLEGFHTTIEFNNFSRDLNGNQTLTYVATAPKMSVGKAVLAGSRVYVITTECLYCTEVPEFDNFVNSFQLIGN